MHTSWSPMISSLILLLLACSSPAVRSDDEQGLIHIPLYVHETLFGPNATVTPLTASPVGTNSSFGSIGVVDDELRVGRDRFSQLVGRFKGFLVDTTSREVRPPEYLSSATLVFTTGEYSGSTLSVEGYLPGSTKHATERAVVGGTGKFRMARGYSLTKTLGKTSPRTDVFQFDLFLLMHPDEY